MNGLARWLAGVVSALGATGCVAGTPEVDTGGATFFQGAPAVPGAPNDYAPLMTAPDIGGAAGTASAPPMVTPAVPVDPAASAGSAAPPPTGTGGSGVMTNAGAGGTAGGGAGMQGGSGGSGGTGTAGMAPPPPPASSGPGMLSVTVTSAAVGGRYAPRNVGAVWIESGSGTFVKTIERWAAIRTSDLRTWNQRSGGWGFSFFGTSSSPDAVDAVTAATLTNHRAHTSTWAMKDVAGTIVPDGDYKVVVEVGDGSNATAELSFTKGPVAQTVMAPAGGRGYSSFTVTYTP